MRLEPSLFRTYEVIPAIRQVPLAENFAKLNISTWEITYIFSFARIEVSIDPVEDIHIQPSTSINRDPNPLRIQPRRHVDKVMLNLHIADIRLKQLQPEPPRRKHGRQHQMKLAVRQILPRALTAAPTKRDEILAQRRLLDEAFGSKGAGVGEEVRIVVQEDRGHADGRHGRDYVALVFERRVGEEALQAAGDAVADAETL